MIADEINSCLTEKGFRRIGVNVKDIYLHSFAFEQETYLVMVLDCSLGSVFTSEQYHNIRTQIYNKSMEQGNGPIRLLSIICTNNMNNVRAFYTEGEEQWFIDTENNSLILYEGQSGNFFGLREIMEAILQNKSFENESFRSRPREITRKFYGKGYFTKCNTLLVLVNIIVFMVINYPGSSVRAYYLLNQGGLFWPAIKRSHEYYRVFTYMFLHSGTDHLINNMIVLLFVGDNLERAIGKWKYLIIYFGSGVLAGIASMSYNMLSDTMTVSVGASGAIFGVVGAMAYIVIVNKGRLENLTIRQMVLFVIVSLYGGLTSRGIDNAAHVGGLIAGIIISIILYKRPDKRWKEGGIEL